MSTPTIHVLRRRNWRFAGDYLVLLPGRVRLQSFADADEADKECRDKNQAIRARVNPFRCGGPALRNQTSLDADRLHDWALDQGLTPPEGGDWAAWWDEQSPKLTELQRDGMWKALDRLGFYEVVEQPQRPVVYIAVAINWQYYDNRFVADSEGGVPQFAFRTRQEAEDYVEEANEHQRDNWEDPALAEEPEEGRAFDMHFRRQSLEDVDSPLRVPSTPNATSDEIDFVEIIEVELEGCVVPRKKTLYVVQRVAWCPLPNENLGRGVCEQCRSAEGFPVRAFETNARATNYVKHLTREARRVLNPFQFTYHHVTELMDADEKHLISTIAELGLPLPTPASHKWSVEFIDWPAWYDDLADTLTNEERDTVWQHLDRLELYRVVEVEFL